MAKNQRREKFSCLSLCYELIMAAAFVYLLPFGRWSATREEEEEEDGIVLFSWVGHIVWPLKGFPYIDDDFGWKRKRFKLSGLISARFSDEKGITHGNSKCKELFIHFDVCLKKLCAFPFLPNCMATLISPQCDEATTKQQSRRHCPSLSLYYSPECASILFLSFFTFLVFFLLSFYF